MIEVGEYVRTANGIRKLVAIDTECNNYYIEILNSERTMPLAYEVISGWKHSKNIIDLIEVGDYVNGREVKHIAMFEGFPDYPKLIFVDEKHLVPGETAENKDIETILTKEQMEANQYVVK